MSKVIRFRRPKSRRKNGAFAGPFPAMWWWVVPVVLLLALLSPWQRLVNNFFYPYLAMPEVSDKLLRDQSLLLSGKTELAKEVERLSGQNLELILDRQRARALERENQELRALLGLKSKPGFQYVACDVILRDPWLWHDGFTINRGSKDGLIPGLAVLAARPDRNDQPILLGVIESVSQYSSRVISVLNPEFHISVSLPESGTVGFLNAGQQEQWGGGLAAIGFLPANSTFALHELVYTTGFEALIPAGLLLGSLESIEPSARPFGNRLYRNGIMRSAGDFERLGSVIVAQLKKSGSAEGRK